VSSPSHIQAEPVELAAPAPRGLFARIFSFPAMCMFLLIAAIFGFSVRSISEPDIWWHLRNGEQTVLHHAIPRVDTYSFGAAGSPWLDHEWLSEVPYFLAFKAAGLKGIVALYFAILVLIYTGVYYRSCHGGADCKSATLTTFLAILLGVVSIGPRMLLFGWLCMVALLMVLDHFRTTGKGLWMLPPLFALWINLHGSWIFGMFVFAVILASGLVEGEWGVVTATRWTTSERNRLGLAFFASAAALLITPFGYRLMLYPFDLLFRQPANLKYIEEWRSVDFSSGNGKVGLILIFALLAVALFSRRRWRLDEVLLTTFALWTGLSHLRLMFFAGIIIPPILAAHFELFPPYDPEIDKPWLNAAIMFGLVGGVIFYFPSAARLQQDVDSNFPTAALKFMRRNHLQGRIFNTDIWGGYMEWNTPELKPFLDGRVDIFVYNGAFEDHVSAVMVKNSFEILDKHHIDFVLLEPKRPLTYLLEHSQDWQSIYSDRVATLFQRTGASATELK